VRSPLHACNIPASIKHRFCIAYIIFLRLLAARIASFQAGYDDDQCTSYNTPSGSAKVCDDDNTHTFWVSFSEPVPSLCMSVVQKAIGKPAKSVHEESQPRHTQVYGGEGNEPQNVTPQELKSRQENINEQDNCIDLRYA
jgi:hypothetical protein